MKESKKGWRYLVAGIIVLLFAAGGVLVLRWATRLTPRPVAVESDTRPGLASLLPDKLAGVITRHQKEDEPRELPGATMEIASAKLEEMPEPPAASLGELSAQTRDTLRLRYNLGVLNFYRGDTAGALKAFSSVLEIDPQGVYGRRAFIQMGIIHDRLGDYAGAIESLRKAVTLDATDPVAAHNLGLALMHAGKAGEAVPLLEKAAQLDGANAVILRDLSNAYAATGNIDAALKAAKNALTIDDRRADVRFNLGLLHYRRKEYADAQEQFDAARRGLKGEQAARAEAHLGMTEYQRGFFGDAAASFGRAAALDPKVIDYRFNEAVALAKSGMRPEAARAFRQVAQQTPQDPVAWFGLGSVLYMDGQLDQALDAYRRGLQIDSSATGPLFTVGYIHFATNDLVNAGECFARVIQLGGPDAARAQVNLGLCYEARGMLAEAERAYSLGDQGDPRTFYNLGLVRRKLGQREAAVQAFQKAVELKPNEARYTAALADAFMATDRPDAAVAAYERAVASGGEDFDILIRLAQLTTRLEWLEKATQWVQRARAAARTDQEKALAELAQGLLSDRKGDMEAALASLGRAAAADKTNPDIYYNMGVIDARLMKFDEAVDALRVAIRLRPDMAPAYTQLGNIFYTRGLYDEAVQAYRMAVSLDSGAIEAAFNLKKATAAQSGAQP